MSQESDTPTPLVETYTKSVEREYTSFNGEEVPTAYAIDFLEELSISETVMQHRWRVVESMAEVLVEEGIIDESYTSSWYVSDEAAVDNLLEELYESSGDW